MIKAIFFDLYETLITEWEDGKKKATYSTNELGIEDSLYKKEWRARVNDRMDGTYPDHPSVLRDILQTVGKPIDEKIIEKVHEQRVKAKLTPFQSIESSILSLLQELKSTNIKLGVISNCTPEEVIGWNDSELPYYFDDVVFSYEIRERKPNYGIYQKACERLNVLPTEAIFIGDGGSNELQGAASAGMKAFHATWFLPEKISKKMSGYPKLNEPMDILKILTE